MEQLPFFLSTGFILITVLTIFLLYKAAGNTNMTWIILGAWLAVQSVLGLTGFYTVTSAMPPRLLLAVAPPLLFIAGLIVSRKGRRFTASLNLETLTLLHVVRVPVEIGLYFLSVYKVVPELMTFGGRNFDILSGLSAPLIWYFGFVKKIIPSKLIIAWNFICLGLLFNIVLTALLSAPFPFQQLAFGQPNIAILYFPFVWLPCCIVPVVLYAHIAAISQLMKKPASYPSTSLAS